jgi:hypothetical protein
MATGPNRREQYGVLSECLEEMGGIENGSLLG